MNWGYPLHRPTTPARTRPKPQSLDAGIRESLLVVSLVFSPVQQHNIDISDKRPLQLVIIFTRHDLNHYWNVCIFACNCEWTGSSLSTLLSICPRPDTWQDPASNAFDSVCEFTLTEFSKRREVRTAYLTWCFIYTGHHFVQWLLTNGHCLYMYQVSWLLPMHVIWTMHCIKWFVWWHHGEITAESPSHLTYAHCLQFVILVSEVREREYPKKICPLRWEACWRYRFS